MNGFSRFPRLPRRLSNRSVTRGGPVLLVAVCAAFVRCIPTPDTSGLPPFDAGALAPGPDAAFIPPDASFDATVAPDDAGAEAAAVDSGPPLGTISGIVIDYSQGNGKGVAPGAVVTLSTAGGAAPAALPAAVTTDANGLFTIANVPAGIAIQVGTTKPTDLVNGVAYSSTYLTTTVGAGQTVSLFPVLHEGCYQVIEPADAGGVPVTLDNATCAGPAVGTHPGAYAALSFTPTSFRDLTGQIWTGSARVEMIPLAYPVLGSGVPDLSWSVGLPGTATPAGVLGAAQYRVVKSSPGQSEDGQPLSLGSGSSVTIAVPLFTTPTAPQALTTFYDPVVGSWTTPSALSAEVTTSAGGVSYVTVPITQLAWWAVVNGTPATTCVTGTVHQAGNAVAYAAVRAAGVTYLGTSTAVTSATGTFCLDVAATGSDGGGAAITVVPELLSSGVPYAASQTFPITAATGSCAAPAGCGSLGAPLALAPVETCVAGNVLDGGAITTLNAILQTPEVAYATTAGIQPTAYLGQVALGANGAFCAQAPPGEVQLAQPGNLGCYADLTVLSGSTATACSAGGCSDAGAVPFYCHTLP